MKQEQNSFSRLWTYLRAYRLEVCLSIFLKISKCRHECCRTLCFGACHY